MIEPAMKARPPRKMWSARISAAAARFPARPVIEIAFGVRRDSIRRFRVYERHACEDRDPEAPPSLSIRLLPWRDSRRRVYGSPGEELNCAVDRLGAIDPAPVARALEWLERRVREEISPLRPILRADVTVAIGPQEQRRRDELADACADLVQHLRIGRAVEGEDRPAGLGVREVLAGALHQRTRHRLEARPVKGEAGAHDPSTQQRHDGLADE